MYALHTYIDNILIRTIYHQDLDTLNKYKIVELAIHKDKNVACEIEEAREIYRAIYRDEICDECGKNYIQYNQTVYCMECIKTVNL